VRLSLDWENEGSVRKKSSRFMHFGRVLRIKSEAES
jgi:hypothetical protein